LPIRREYASSDIAGIQGGLLRISPFDDGRYCSLCGKQESEPARYRHHRESIAYHSWSEGRCVPTCIDQPRSNVQRADMSVSPGDYTLGRPKTRTQGIGELRAGEEDE